MYDEADKERKKVKAFLKKRLSEKDLEHAMKLIADLVRKEEGIGVSNALMD